MVLLLINNSIFQHAMIGPNLFIQIYLTTLNSFSLVDIYKNHRHQSITSTHKIKSNIEKFEIIVHPFSSSERKFWAINKWEEIILQVLKNTHNSFFTIFGSKEEEQRAYELLNLKRSKYLKTE